MFDGNANYIFYAPLHFFYLSIFRFLNSYISSISYTNNLYSNIVSILIIPAIIWFQVTILYK